VSAIFGFERAAAMINPGRALLLVVADLKGIRGRMS
jgi:hypothetical protein